VHFLIVTDRAVRSDGETLVQGLKPSARRNSSRTMSFIRAAAVQSAGSSKNSRSG
jgi:hypothetical protein